MPKPQGLKMPPNRKGISLTEEHKEKIRQALLGRKISDETKSKMSLARIGKSPANKGKSPSDDIRLKMSIAKIGKPMCESTKEKLLVVNTGRIPTDETRKKISQAHLRNHHPDGIFEPKENRRCVNYKLWREDVYKRDNFTCQKTGKRGGRLHAHHIINFSTHPELRYQVDNGITFSRESHIKFHSTYGEKNNTKEQLEEFLGKEHNYE